MDEIYGDRELTLDDKELLLIGSWDQVVRIQISTMAGHRHRRPLKTR